MPQAIKSFIKKLFPKSIREKLLPIYHWFRAVMANVVYGFPTHGMVVIGVTGTNGKTTTTNMIGKILTEAGYKTGIFSSAVVQIGDDWQDSAMKLTTEDVFVLNEKFSQMKKAGVTHLVLEVSSHAIAQHRIFGVHFSGAVFTNLSQDHLDYHHSMDEYAKTKKKLFKKANDFIVINTDNQYSNRFLVKPKEVTITYGKKPSADIKITDIDVSQKGASATLVTSNEKIPIKINLSGEFNLYNSAAAVAVARKLGLGGEQIIGGLKALKNVPGRMETIDEGQAFTVVVDHAHTPDALDNLLGELKKTTKEKLVLILGADGERDPSKRGPLATIASKYCDFIYVTDQEPYGDDPDPIRRDLVDGLQKAKFSKFEEIADRKKAIETAFSKAKPGDTVLIAGLGNQKYRGMNEGKVKWDEREVARGLLGK